MELADVAGSLTDEKTSRRELAAKWKAIVSEYQEPSFWRASWQIVNTIVPYLTLWFLMYLSLAVSWWVTIPLAILAGCFLVRAFIIFHDCGHGSFFKSTWANDTWGFLTGILTLTPYYHWRWEHSVHHASTGHLDRRGIGDIWTMTVEEYLQASRWKKLTYRLARNPIILFVIGPLFLFLFRERFPTKGAKRRELASVWIMDLVLVGVATCQILLFGFWPWLIIQVVITWVAGSAGIWLFYVQHQFEDAYWERGEDWDYTEAAIKGSSFYKLPKVLQWFSGNIGFHHIHHLSSRIPNYNLERCHRSDPMFEEVESISLLGSLKTLTYRLWDEKAKKLISFGRMRKGEREKLARSESVADDGDETDSKTE